MACGKKAADTANKATPADTSDETHAEPTELTRDTTTLALLQALALNVDALSTRLDEHDDNINKEQRDIPSDDDEVRESGKEPSANVVDGLLAALEDKRLEVGLTAAAKAHAPATFKRQVTERDSDRDKARHEKDKAARERREQKRREAEAKNRNKNGDTYDPRLTVWRAAPTAHAPTPAVCVTAYGA
eukprot:jgi/Tetstr1/438438/TSEL_026995.t1